MTEYIAKNLAIELMHQASYLSDGDLLEVNGNLAKARIEAEPAADVVPMVHGEWIHDGHHRRCNRCGTYFCNTDREGDTIPNNFCPNCGAKMDGGKNT